MNKCYRCEKPNGTIFIQYREAYVCKNCFISIQDQRIRKAMREQQLIQSGDKIAIAVSGGKDSITLLNVMHKYTTDRKDIELFVIYIDRGDQYSVDSLLKAKSAADGLKIPFHCFSFENELNILMKDITKIAKEIGTNKCSVCGVFRRRLLDKKSRELGANKLATGHNLTDEAGSYLMNFIRNDIDAFAHLGYKSESSKGFVQRIRPLRDIPDDEVKQYADLKEYDYFPKPCPCREGSLRFNIENTLEDMKKARPSAEFSIVQTGDWIRERALRAAKSNNLKRCKTCGELTSKDKCRVCYYLGLK